MLNESQMALPFYRLQKAPVTVLLIYQRKKDALVCPFPFAIIIRTSLFSKGPRLIFKKCVSIDVTAGRLFCQVPASSTAKVPWLGRAFIKPHLIKESVILSMFASVFKHMVSISGVKMANTCFTFVLTFPRDVLSRRWWDRRIRGGCEWVCVVLFCFLQLWLTWKSTEDCSGKHEKTFRLFYVCNSPKKHALLTFLNCPNGLPSLPCLLQGAGDWLTLQCESISAAKNLSSWILNVNPLEKGELWGWSPPALCPQVLVYQRAIQLQLPNSPAQRSFGIWVGYRELYLLPLGQRLCVLWPCRSGIPRKAARKGFHSSPPPPPPNSLNNPPVLRQSRKPKCKTRQGTGWGQLQQGLPATPTSPNRFAWASYKSTGTISFSSLA